MFISLFRNREICYTLLRTVLFGNAIAFDFFRILDFRFYKVVVNYMLESFSSGKISTNCARAVTKYNFGAQFQNHLKISFE